MMLPVDNPGVHNPFKDPRLVDAKKATEGVFGQQAGLAELLLLQALGGGPNPAAAALNQATNANNAQAASLIASSKGMTPGMAARMAASTGANLNQQAAGQSAVMQAQQQLGAANQLGGLYGTMGSQRLQHEGLLHGALDSYVKNMITNVSQANSAKAGVAAVNAGKQHDMFMGALKGLGSAIGLHKGGVVPGGESSGGPSSFVGKHLSGSSIPVPMSSGGKVEAPAPKHIATKGGHVPGKAKVKGDSPKNDTVPARLSPGEIVIPRSIAQGKDAPQRAAEFVAAVLAQAGSLKR